MAAVPAEVELIEILSNTLKTKQNIDPSAVFDVSINIFNVAGNVVECPNYTIYNYKDFITELVNLREALKRQKIKLAGTFIGILRTRKNEYVSVNLFKVKATQIVIFDGDLKVLFKEKDKADQKKKFLTIEEKLKLFQEWHNINPGQEPSDKSIHKDFNVGRFYKKSMKDAEVKNSIDKIMNEN